MTATPAVLLWMRGGALEPLIHRRPKMETVEIKVVLTDAAVADILDAITHTSTRLLARDPDAIYATLKQRRAAVGGMLELARRLNAHRLPSRTKPPPAASAAATGGRWPRIGFANPKREPTCELRPY
jgi:hypothetical protein